jgi:hypothetical protein
MTRGQNRTPDRRATAIRLLFRPLRVGSSRSGTAALGDRGRTRKGYFSAVNVASIFMTSPLTWSVAVVYCAVWPSRRRMLNVAVNDRKDG